MKIFLCAVRKSICAISPPKPRKWCGGGNGADA
jgi:hypothetical protein